MNKRIILGLILTLMIGTTHTAHQTTVEMCLSKSRDFASQFTGTIVVTGIGATAYGLTYAGVAKNCTSEFLIAQVFAGIYLSYQVGGTVYKGIKKLDNTIHTYTGANLPMVMSGLALLYCIRQIYITQGQGNQLSNIFELLSSPLLKIAKGFESCANACMKITLVPVQTAYDNTQAALQLAQKHIEKVARGGITKAAALQSQKLAADAADEALKYANATKLAAEKIGTTAALKLAEEAIEQANNALKYTASLLAAINSVSAQ